MKSQWECVLENLGEWVGSFTAVTAAGELIEDIPSVIDLEGVRDNQAIHLVLKRFYPLPGSTERYAKEVVWDFSTPPGVGAVYFETGAFSSGTPVVIEGIKTIVEFALIATDRRFRTIHTFDASHRLDRVTFVREYRQGSDAPERPHLYIADLCGTWTGVGITALVDGTTTSAPIESSLTVRDLGYELVSAAGSIDLVVISARLLQFAIDRDGQSYQLLLLPDGGYTISPTQIRREHPFEVEIGWMYRNGKRQRLVRRYDRQGNWESTTFSVEERANDRS